MGASSRILDIESFVIVDDISCDSKVGQNTS